MPKDTHLKKKRKCSPSRSCMKSKKIKRRERKQDTVPAVEMNHNHIEEVSTITEAPHISENLSLVHLLQHNIVPQTDEKISKQDTAQLEKRIGGLRLSTYAKRALANGRIVADVLKDYPEKIMYNHKEELLFHGERLYRENNMSSLLQLVPDIKETHSTFLFLDPIPSVLLLSFLLRPENWVKESEMHLEEGNSNLSDLINVKQVKTNTRCVDHDTDFPAVERGEEKMACVIVGCDREIQETFSANLDYGETCNNIFNSIYGGGVRKKKGKKGGPKSGYCTANNFSVLVGMEYQKMVKCGNSTRLVDFFQQTRECLPDGGLVPLLLTSCCEAVHRVQLQYVQLLYDMGAICLHPEPVDSSRMLYRLADTDAASLAMQMRNSKVMLYSVMIWCQACRMQHNHLWNADLERDDPFWLESYKCMHCGGYLTNDSCFVINGNNNKNKRDPATVRGIKYKVYKVDGKEQLPEGVNGKDELPQYEHVSPEVNAKSLQIYLRQDYSRKIQTHPTVSLSLFVPICYDVQSTKDALEKRFGGSVELDNRHHVEGYCFVQGREHKIQMMLNRFKISLTLNKTVTVHVHEETLFHHFFCKMHHLKNTFAMKEHNSLQISVPVTQTNRRIGVQTVDSEGNVCKHTSQVLIRSSVRKGNDTAQHQRTQEVGDMFTAIHLWCIANESKENNFVRYGATLTAGLVNNFFHLARAKLENGSTERVLQPGQFPWLELDAILPSMSQATVEVLYNKTTHKLRTVNKDIQELQKQIRERDRMIETMKCQQSDMMKRGKESEEMLKMKERECKQLLEQRDMIERDLRVMTRAYKTLKEQHNNLEGKVEEMLERNRKVEEFGEKWREEYDKKFQKVLSALDKISTGNDLTPPTPPFQEAFDADTLEANLPRELDFTDLSLDEVFF